jgi:hypothetical protein
LITNIARETLRRLRVEPDWMGATTGEIMKIVPLTIAEAEEFLKKHDRHYKVPVEKLCAVGVGIGETGTGAGYVLHGAAILGRRTDGDGELAHIYVDGTSQGYSLLYGACWRVLKALGYEKAAL